MNTPNQTNKDAFDLWWEWATKDRANSMLTIDADIQNAVMMLTPEERMDRAIVNEAVRTDEPATSGRKRGSVWSAEGGGIRKGMA